MNEPTSFCEQLRELLNKMCMENSSNTSNFILAEYLQNCLFAYEKAIVQRDVWYDFQPWKSDENSELQEVK